jgi:hypothetical protein
MLCPRCGTQYAFFETKCTRCNVDLVEGDAPESGPSTFAASNDEGESSASGGQPETGLVSVFKTSDPGLVPLATMALEGEGIEYFVKHAGKADSLEWMMSQSPTTRPIVVEIVVGSDVAAKARDLLVDLEGPVPPMPATDVAAASSLASPEPPTVRLEDAVAGTAIGAINESQLQDLTSRLEEDGPQEYFITGETVDMLQTAGVDAAVIALLRQAVGTDGSGRAIRWVVR